MRNNPVYKFLYEARKNGDDSYYSTTELTLALNLPNNGNTFRLMNLLAVKYEVLEVIFEGASLRRKYRIKESELENESG